jgi:uncharacterized membrane protein YkoI
MECMMRKRLIWSATISAVLLTATAFAAPNTIGVRKAVDIAERAIPGQVVEVDLDTRRNSRLYYEVVVARRDGVLHELIIDAMTGKIKSTRQERLETFWLRLTQRGTFTALAKMKPLSRMLAEVERDSNGQVIDVDFELEGGQARYEVEVSTRAGIASIYLDARSGKRLAYVIDD